MTSRLIAATSTLAASGRCLSRQLAIPAWGVATVVGPLSVRRLNTNGGELRTSDRYITGKSRGLSPTELRGKLVDDSDQVEDNVHALTAATMAAEASKAAAAEFSTFPDETSAEQLFNGVKYKDLPYVTVICTFNHTKLWANAADGTWLHYTSPRLNGFLNAKKRTGVAAQAAGLAMGQKLRTMNIKTVRVRVDGFNSGRIATLTGIAQAGINIVSVSDVTPVDWGWAQRAQKRKRRN